MTPKQKIPIILGPTASGKTALAVQLAKKIVGEIISADSRQVYRDMDIGSGKDLSEYGSIPYHLIDIRPAGTEYSVSDFQVDTMVALSDITQREHIPIICGGTGHYVKSLLDDYQFSGHGSDLELTRDLESLPRSELYEKLKKLGLWETRHWESDSRRRMARAIEKKIRPSLPQHPGIRFNDCYQPLCFYIKTERQQLIRKIEKRLRERLNSGLIEEVENLVSKGVSHHRLERYGLEYRWVSRYIRTEISYEVLFEKLAVDIRRYAKRQMTFIRYLQKKGHRIDPITDVESFPDQVAAILSPRTQSPSSHPHPG